MTSGQISEDQRLAGLDADAGEVEAGADAGKGRLHQVEFARRDAAGNQQQVSFHGLSQSRVQRPGVVCGGWQNPWLAARRGYHRGKHGGVRVANLTGSGRCFDWDQFVACGENGHTRPDIDLKRSAAASRSQGYLRVRDRGSGGEEFIAFASLRALGYDVFARLDDARREQPDLVAGP